MGYNAMLELGPGGGNLMGAMRGARIIANELHSLMWAQPDGSALSARSAAATGGFGNQYAALLGDSGAESDGASSEEEEGAADEHSAAMAASAARARPPASKKTKQQKALEKARKHRRATKTRRGMN